MGPRGKIRALARYIDFNLVIFRLRWKASWFPNLVSLLPESKIKRANLLAVCQNINTVFTGDCSSLREDECFSTRMRCVKCASKKKNNHNMTTVEDSRLWITLSHYFLLTSLMFANLIKGLVKGCEGNYSNSDSNVYLTLQYWCLG